MTRHPLVDRFNLVEQPAQHMSVRFGARRAEDGPHFAQPEPHVANELVEFGPIARHVEGRALDAVETRWLAVTVRESGPRNRVVGA